MVCTWCSPSVQHSELSAVVVVLSEYLWATCPVDTLSRHRPPLYGRPVLTSAGGASTHVYKLSWTVCSTLVCNPPTCDAHGYYSIIYW